MLIVSLLHRSIPLSIQRAFTPSLGAMSHVHALPEKD
jgi:hypothetical protein